jgi:hypothetical protein
VGRSQQPDPKEVHVFRIHLIVTVILALTCTGLSAAANSPSTPAVSQRPDGRLLPDSADIPRAGSRTRGASSEGTGVTGGRPDGRTLPDAADLGTAGTPTVIYVDRESTTSFVWLDALIGGLVVAGVALAVGGLLVVRGHSPTLAR